MATPVRRVRTLATGVFSSSNGKPQQQRQPFSENDDPTALTTALDSFVLIDGDDDHYYEQDDDDPYLESRQALQARMLRSRHRNNSKSNNSKSPRQQPSWNCPAPVVVSPCTPLLADSSHASTTHRSCSLGTFDFPTPSIQIPVSCTKLEVEATETDTTLASESGLLSDDDDDKEQIIAEHEEWLANHLQPNLKRARVLLQLGQTKQSVAHVRAAALLFQRAGRTVAQATALHTQGRIHTQRGEHNEALQVLQQALEYRLAVLGPWHVDTVSTMKHMGAVHLANNDVRLAVSAYWQVFWVSRAIYGTHPATAVAAHDLGQAWHQAGRLQDARNFYQVAADLYAVIGVPRCNPAVARLERHQRRLERTARVFENDV